MPRHPRSEHDDGRQQGSASPDDWHAAYAGDSFDGIGKPDDEDTYSEGD